MGFRKAGIALCARESRFDEPTGPAMGRKLWFIGNGERPINVFPSQRSAHYEMEALEREAPDDLPNYEIYGIDVDDLEDHPIEFRLAENEDLV
jgi:hypothetical protein